MNKIILAITTLIASCQQSLNQTLSALPPIEQLEATSEAAGILRHMKSSASYLKETFGAFEAKMSEYKASIQKEIEDASELLASTKLEAKLSGGEYIKKSDADAAQQVAVQGAETALRASMKKITDRRKEITEGEGAVSVEIASLLSDETLAADDYKLRASKAGARCKTLTDLGVAVPAVLSETANLGIDEAGEKLAADKIATFQGVAAKHGGKPGGLAGGGESQNQSKETGDDIVAL